MQEQTPNQTPVHANLGPDHTADQAASAAGAPVSADRALSADRAEKGLEPSVWDRVDEFDDLVDAAFDRLRGNPVFDRLFYAASELGDHALIWHLLAAAAAAASPAKESHALKVIGALAVESALVNGLIKSLFNRSRPVVEAPRPLHLRIPRTSSFPSGHASSATMAAMILAAGSKHPGVYGAVAAVIATSRIHVRIHHASDVIGGVAVGAALGTIAKRMLR